LLKLAADLPELTAEQMADLDEIEKANQLSSTSYQTRQHVLTFKNFFKNKGLCENFETVPDNYLCDYLRYFYANIRKDDESLYTPASLVCIRASIHRFLTYPEVNRKVDILNGDIFKRVNGVLKGMIGKYLKSHTKN